MLQGFTSDLAVLKSVVEKTDAGLLQAACATAAANYDNVGRSGGIADCVRQVMSRVAGDPEMAQLIASFQQAEATCRPAPGHARTGRQETLDAMNQMAHYLSGIPGRKNLIWFSGSFPITIFPEPDIEHPFSVVASSEDEFRETTNLMARAQVAVYPIGRARVEDLCDRRCHISRAVAGSNSAGKGVGRWRRTSCSRTMSEDNDEAFHHEPDGGRIREATPTSTPMD